MSRLDTMHMCVPHHPLASALSRVSFSPPSIYRRSIKPTLTEKSLSLPFQYQHIPCLAFPVYQCSEATFARALKPFSNLSLTEYEPAVSHTDNWVAERPNLST